MERTNTINRTWEPNLDFTEVVNADNIVRVTSFNILANGLAPYTFNIEGSEVESNPMLNWKQRKPKILEELRNIDSDIISLQEVERDKDFISVMGEMGYNCGIKPRINGHLEGSGVFWKRSKFELINLYSLELNLRSQKNELYEKDNVCIYAVLKSKKKPNNAFIVGSTHLLFNSNRGDIKIAQLYQILNGFNVLLNNATTDQKFENVYSILCGDFNAVPNSGVYKLITQGLLNCKSLDRRKVSNQSKGDIKHFKIDEDIIEEYKNKHFNNITVKYLERLYPTTFDNENWMRNLQAVKVVLKNQKLQLEEDDKGVLNLNISAPIKMKSAYAENFKNILHYYSSDPRSENKEIFKKLKIPEAIFVHGMKISSNNIREILDITQNLTLEPGLTFYSKDLFTTLDYIFYFGNLKVLKTYNVPDFEDLVQGDQFPNEQFPSDHIPISVDFLFP